MDFDWPRVPLPARPDRGIGMLGLRLSRALGGPFLAERHVDADTGFGLEKSANTVEEVCTPDPVSQ